MDLQTPIDKLFMVGPIYAKRLAKLDIHTVEDLLYHFPHRYEDYSLISKIDRVQPGEIVTIKGTVSAISNEYTKGGKKIQKATVADDTDAIEIVWFNQPFLAKIMRVGETYNFSGKADWFGHKIVMVSPEYERQQLNNLTMKQSFIHTGRLVPIYPETYGVSSKWLRSRIAPILNECSDLLLEYLPSSTIENNQLIDYKNAIREIHFPEDKISAAKARKRLAFDELFLIQLNSLKRKLEWKKETVGNKFQISNFKLQIQKFMENLPFKLTKAQRKAVGEILTDLAKPQPMNRLLEGDVGSGKTVVAAVAMYLAYLNGFQSVIMAPTEILAFQHYQTLKNLLEPLGVKVNLITSSHKLTSSRHAEFIRRKALLISASPPKEILNQVQNDKLDSDIFIGTHALLNEKIKLGNLGLIVIDEQHRFGVAQRAKLKAKGVNPHLLTMTATPIPRTVALTLYGELDLSFLDEMPLGRQKVKTWVVPPEKRNGAYEWIKKQIKTQNGQAFIICPLIEESETLASVKAATKEYESLKREVFSDLRLGLLHGRLKSKEKEETLKAFRTGKLNILVATPVVEVGLDIPSATIMMIEGAERFGLAQLHQLRGRVGRSDLPSYCLLFSESGHLRRLAAMEKIYVGAKLAELDLQLRGPGEIYGTRQHGIPDLKVASLNDLPLVERTKFEAAKIIKTDPGLSQFPLLKEKIRKYIIKAISPD